MGQGMDGFDLRGIIENSLLEWENRVAAVAITGGCNFRCPYCHSWRYVTGLDDLEPRDPEELFRLLERQRGWIDGVVFTGGEPTLQPGLAEIIERTRGYGTAVKLHSNGSRPEVVRNLLDRNLLDCLALDFKAPLDERYDAATGGRMGEGGLDAVRETFALAAGVAGRVEIEYHTTLCPAVVDLPGFLEMARGLPAGGLWILQQYENDDCLAPAGAGRERYDGAMLDAFEVAGKREYGRVLLRRGKSANG